MNRLVAITTATTSTDKTRPFIDYVHMCQWRVRIESAISVDINASDSDVIVGILGLVCSMFAFNMTAVVRV